MTNGDDKDADDLQELLKKNAQQLGEHFESVVIIATKTYSGDDHVRFKASSGNHYANVGSVREWLVFQEEKVRIQARSDCEEE